MLLQPMTFEELGEMPAPSALALASYFSMQSSVVLYEWEEPPAAISATWCGLLGLSLSLSETELRERFLDRKDSKWRDAARRALFFLDDFGNRADATAAKASRAAASVAEAGIALTDRRSSSVIVQLAHQAIVDSWSALTEFARDDGTFANFMLRTVRSQLGTWAPGSLPSLRGPVGRLLPFEGLSGPAPKSWTILAARSRRFLEPVLSIRFDYPMAIQVEQLVRVAWFLTDYGYSFDRAYDAVPAPAAPASESTPAAAVPDSPAPPPASPPASPAWSAPMRIGRALIPRLASAPVTITTLSEQPPPSARGRVVNSGFASASSPDVPIVANVPLGVARRYWFWLEVGDAIAESIERTPTPLPTEHLPPRAKLTVALFTFPGGILFEPGADTGEIELQSDGSARVIRQPYAPRIRDGSAELTERRLFFPIRTRIRTGLQQLRCNIYYQQLLVQSRIISAQVKLISRPKQRSMLVSDLDFTLSRSLDPARLTALPEHRLSLFLNKGRDRATHQLRVFASGLKVDLNISNAALGIFVEELRGTLRMAAWGSRNEWDGRIDAYRYTRPTEALLVPDLARMATAGYRFFSYLQRNLARANRGKSIEDVMREPGMVQFASLNDLSESLPTALIYDYPLDTTAPESLRLCPDFLQAVGRRDLEEIDCFKGHCSYYDNLTVICPSGFWGFRHLIGTPLSLSSEQDGDDLDVSPDLGCKAAPIMAVAVSTDRQFVLRPEHERELKKLTLGGWRYAETRDAALNLLQLVGHHVVYFYCHGGMAGPVPYILLGPPDPTGITPDNLDAFKIKWSAPGPLVFINGCHTTALSPWAALNFVSSFVETAHASAVIGTEITVFEPLACEFAQAFFQAFLVDKVALGAAVRRARLKLLAEMNPLGLAYLPFALASLTLAPTTSVQPEKPLSGG